MASDPERAVAIENSVARSLRFAAEEVERNPDRAASSLSQATTQLDSDAAREHLSAETMERLRAQVAALQVQVEESERAEKAGRIEREIKRFVSAAEEEIRTQGYQAESYLKRAGDRLAAADARDCMAADAIARLQRCSGSGTVAVEGDLGGTVHRTQRVRLTKKPATHRSMGGRLGLEGSVTQTAAPYEEPKLSCHSARVRVT